MAMRGIRYRPTRVVPDKRPLKSVVVVVVVVVVVLVVSGCVPLIVY